MSGGSRKPEVYRKKAADKAKAAGLQSTIISQHGNYEDCNNYVDHDIWADKWGEPKLKNANGRKINVVEKGTNPNSDTNVIVKFIPFYFRDFWNDPRRLGLEPCEQHQFLFLLGARRTCT